MYSSLGIDFGTSNTLITSWDSDLNIFKPLEMPEFSRIYYQGKDPVYLVPSVIHYTSDQRRWIGNQVINQGLYGSPKTMRWMKRYISQRSPLKLSLDGREITPAQAANDFLSTLLAYARTETQNNIEAIGVSVPVESFEHYESWLTEVVHTAGFNTFRLIDEPSSAALGYGEHIQPGSVYMIFDFGGGTLHASVVLIEEEKNIKSNCRCRVLGKAGRDIGGSTIDRWIFEWLLSSQKLSDDNKAVQLNSQKILVACEKAKEALTTQDSFSLALPNGDNGPEINLAITRSIFEDILDRHNLFSQINQTIRTALNGAHERGYDEDNIQSILMIGGSSQIPSVQRCIQQSFGRNRIHSHRPMDAIAIGAARLAGGADFYDFIQHDYAIRFTNPETREYEYKIIIQKGTSYPTTLPATTLMVKGAYDQQKRLGIAIFEIGKQISDQEDNFELVFDPEGCARIMPISLKQQEERTYFWMNEFSPTFIEANPPASRGVSRFDVKFYINENKQLLISVLDTQTQRILFDRTPVIKLS